MVSYVSEGGDGEANSDSDFEIANLSFSSPERQSSDDDDKLEDLHTFGRGGAKVQVQPSPKMPPGLGKPAATEGGAMALTRGGPAVHWDKPRAPASASGLPGNLQPPPGLAPPPAEATAASPKGGDGAGRSRLHREVLEFAHLCQPTREESAAIQAVVDGVKQVALALWPQARVVVFGSRATGLALPDSDVDIVVLGVVDDLENPALGFSRRERTELGTALKDLAGVLKDAKILRDAKVIDAKVPIIKGVDLACGLPVDISLGASNGERAIGYVRSQVVKYEALRPLMLVVKALLSQRGLNEVFTGGIGSYTLLNLIVSHLMKGGGAGGDLGMSLHTFLERFGRWFDYRSSAISVQKGGWVPKPKRWASKTGMLQLAVEDPQQEGKDIGAASFNIRLVREAFAAAADSLHRAGASKSGADAAPASEAETWAAAHGEEAGKSAAPVVAVAGALAVAGAGTSWLMSDAGGGGADGAKPAGCVLSLVLDVQAAVGRGSAEGAARRRSAKAALRRAARGRKSGGGGPRLPGGGATWKPDPEMLGALEDSGLLPTTSVTSSSSKKRKGKRKFDEAEVGGGGAGAVPALVVPDWLSDLGPAQPTPGRKRKRARVGENGERRGTRGGGGRGGRGRDGSFPRAAAADPDSRDGKYQQLGVGGRNGDYIPLKPSNLGKKMSKGKKGDAPKSPGGKKGAGGAPKSPGIKKGGSKGAGTPKSSGIKKGGSKGAGTPKSSGKNPGGVARGGVSKRSGDGRGGGARGGRGGGKGRGGKGK